MLAHWSSYAPVKISNINADVATKPLPKTEVIRWTSHGW
jgi:hypothetical protein